MKNLRHIFLTAFCVALTLASFGQASELFFSEYSEGSSNNKYLEIYNGTGAAVDLTPYTVRLGSNGNPWGTTFTFGTVQLADKDVFVIANAGSDPIILAEADATSTVTYFNGDDALGLFKDDILIDAIGVEGEDPGSYWPVAGVNDGTKEHTLVRKADVCSPTTDWALSAGTNADDSQWIVSGQNDWTNIGFHISECQGGTTVATPLFTPGGGTYSNPVSVSITCETPGAAIYYTTDGSDPTEQSQLYTLPLSITQTTTLKARAFLEGYNPSYITTAQYVFAETVSTLAELRAGIPGHLYHYTGTAFLTFQQGFRNQKYVQDATAGILIDDDPGVIFSDFEIGDGITNLYGQVAEYNGMMQFTPTQDPGDPVSSGNYPEPLVITLTDLNNNFSAYDARLVRVNGVTFDDAGETFANGSVYHLTGPAAGEGDFRTTFYDVDYIGTTIPAVPMDIIGLPNARSEGNYLTARSNNDLIQNLVPPSIQVTAPNGGEVWQKGETYNITWLNLNFGGNVKITVTKPPFTNIVLADNLANTGSYEWAIPMSFAVGSNYKVKVQGVNPSDPLDLSDANFSVIEPLPDPDIVINEIMYNPAYELGNDADYEYLELYNNSGFAVDLGGWSLTNAISYTFEAGTTIADGGYLVVAIKPDTIISHYGISNVVGPFSGALNNTGEAIVLLDTEGAIADSVTYADGGLWPTEPDGGGPSLELLDPNLDNSLPENWAASLVNDGTPGMANSVLGAELLTLTAPNGGETFAQGSSQEVAWTYLGFTGTIKIELTDTQLATTVTLAENVPVNAGVWNWEIPADFATSNNYKIIISETTDGMPTDESDGVFSIVGTIVPAITVTSPNGGESWEQGTLHNITWTSQAFEGDVKIELSDGISTILLEDSIAASEGTYAWAIPAGQAVGSNYTVIISGLATGAPSDASDAPFSVVTPQPIDNIVINEIMYNGPEGGTDTTEFIELYNRGTSAVNLENYYFSQGVEFVFPDYELAPDSYLVVAYRANVMLNSYGIEALQWTGGGLSNSGETLELMNSAGQQVDIVNFDDGGVWPVAPDGYGPSLALTDPFADNNDGTNWKPETTFAFTNADGMAVYATPGAANFAIPGQGILLKSGLSGISTYLDLNNPAMETNMQPVVEKLLGAQDFSNVYLPGNGVNTIGNWNPDKGYQINLTSQLYLVLYGTESTDHTAALTTGWNGLPVLSSCPVDAAALFGGHAEIIFVKEMGSNRIYYPAGNVFTLQTLQPGSACFIKVSAPINLTYPDCEGK
ncbi:MAG: lamin tail domain-containing protein [Bacteroidales bacterium]|nr:lamin tail domain-containing protein [Bacteroidales bacterium]